MMRGEHTFIKQLILGLDLGLLGLKGFFCLFLICRITVKLAKLLFESVDVDALVAFGRSGRGCKQIENQIDPINHLQKLNLLFFYYIYSYFK